MNLTGKATIKCLFASVFLVSLLFAAPDDTQAQGSNTRYCVTKQTVMNWYAKARLYYDKRDWAHAHSYLVLVIEILHNNHWPITDSRFDNELGEAKVYAYRKLSEIRGENSALWKTLRKCCGVEISEGKAETELAEPPLRPVIPLR